MKTYNLKLLPIIGFLCIVFWSCEEAFFDNEPANNPQENFNTLWETVDQKYTFFEAKNINWDSVRRVYDPLVTQNTSEFELFQIMEEMLFILRDGHVNLTSGFDKVSYNQYYLEAPPNFSFDLVERNYLRSNLNAFERTGPFQNTFLDSIGYVYYGSFSSNFNKSHLNWILSKFRIKGVKGLIFDVRDNSGGSLQNALDLVSRFTDEKRLVYQYRFKSGPDHNDFTQLFDKYVEPEGPFQYNELPVVVLSNRSSYSATTFFVQSMKALPNVTVMGDATGGGGGIPISNELPNGWRYRFSSSVTYAPDGTNIEFGVEPDIKVDMDSTLIPRGIDTIIERAKIFIRNQSPGNL